MVRPEAVTTTGYFEGPRKEKEFGKKLEESAGLIMGILMPLLTSLRDRLIEYGTEGGEGLNFIALLFDREGGITIHPLTGHEIGYTVKSSAHRSVYLAAGGEGLTTWVEGNFQDKRDKPRRFTINWGKGERTYEEVSPSELIAPSPKITSGLILSPRCTLKLSEEGKEIACWLVSMAKSQAPGEQLAFLGAIHMGLIEAK